MNVTRYTNDTNKKILVLAGVHGNETTPLICIKNLIDKFNCEYDKTFHNITLINCINRSGLIANTRNLQPISNTEDLNRKFMSNNNLDFSVLKEQLDLADIIIDIHSSPNCKELCLLNIDSKTNSYIEYLKNLSILYCCRYSSENTIKKYCLDNNKIAFTVELNGTTFVDEQSAKVGCDMVFDIIKNIDSFDTTYKNKQFQNIKEIIMLKSPEEGLFYLTKPLGEIFNVGDDVGYILTLSTFKKVPVISNVFGMVVCGNDKQYYKFAEPILEIQPL